MSIPTPTLNLPVHTYSYPKLTLKTCKYIISHLIGSMFRRYTASGCRQHSGRQSRASVTEQRPFKLLVHIWEKY